jgi:hypothetical protein
MSINIKTRYVLIATLVLFLGIFFGGWFLGHHRASNIAKGNIKALTEEISHYKYTVDSLQKDAYEKGQVILSQREAIDIGLIERKELRKLNLRAVNELTSLKGQIQILKDSIAHNGNVIIVQPCDSVGEPQPAIVLPFAFKEENKDYRLTSLFNSFI